MIYSEIISYLFSLDNFFLYVVYELVNYFFCVGILCLTYKLRFLTNEHFFIWLFLFSTPFLFNYILFDPLLFQDQFGYSNLTAKMVTEGPFNVIDLSFNNINDLRTYGVDIAAAIFAFSPIPLNVSVTSLAFTNKLLMFLFFLWIYRQTGSKNSIYLFLVPSLVLYTSLSLRDPIIIILSSVFMILLIRNRILLPLIILFIVGLLKIQNAIVLVILFFGYILFKAHLSYLRLLIFLLVFLSIGFIFEDLIVSALNFFRIAFYSEDIGSHIPDTEKVLIAPSETFLEVALYSIISAPNFLLMPLIWNASGVLQLVQSLESILIVILMGYFYLLSHKANPRTSLFLIFTLIVGLSIYAYVIFNEGTGVRYRFTLLFPYLITFYYLYSQDESKKANLS